MNRTILVAVFFQLVVIQLFAQKTYQNNPKNGSVNNSIQAATDTLFGNFFDGTPALYKSQELFPGYASGNNAYGDLAKTQVFSISNTSAVEGAIIWMGYKNSTSANPNSQLKVNLYDLKSTATGFGATALKLSPDSIIRSTTINIDDIDTSVLYENGANIFLFNTPAYFDTLFAIGFDFSLLAGGDTVACYTNTNGDSDSLENAWEQVSDSSWATMLRNWGLNIDFAIFPIIDATQTGLSPLADKGFNFSVFPNPAANYITITVNNNLQAQPENYVIVDSNGKSVLSGNTINAPINIQGLNTGLYYIIVYNANGNGYAQKLVKQ
jgi:Secretion system C-terminal sorting domain